ncbi:MAG: penicillin-binding protein 3 [Candidatus Hydrogenedentota bacterium]
MRRTDTDMLPVSNFQKSRMRWVFWFFLFGFFAVSARLTQLHLTPDERIIKEQNGKLHVAEVTIQAPRGKIFDREGRVMALDREAPSLWGDPSAMDDIARAAQVLSLKLSIDEKQLFTRLNARSANGRLMQDVPIKRWLSEEEFKALGPLDELIGPGLRVKHEPVRFYPERKLASHVLGYVNREQVGVEGVEAVYHKYLHSVDGRHKARVDRDRNLLNSQTLEYVAPEGGDDIHLTLDKAIQHGLERSLEKAMEENEATRAMGIIMDVHTGAILALASLPAFDPNVFNEYTPELRKNRAITDVFEPGSAFKIVTAAAALETGAVTLDSTVNCEGGQYVFAGRRLIKDVHKMNVVTFAECFAESSNIGIIKVADRLGPEVLNEWIQRFGFGQRTCKDLPAESPGIYRPKKQWSKLSPISLPIGQEIAVTMLQLGRAFSAIANGGYLVEPHLVTRAVNKDGQITFQRESKEFTRIMSQETSDTMRELCYQVVTHGTGKYARIPEYRVGGKTGTAQIANLETGGYYRDRYNSVFAGFAPVTSPRIATVIVVHNPQGKSHYGGYVCGPIFKEVVREALIRLAVPEDPMEEEFQEKEAPAPVQLASLPNAPTVPAEVQVPAEPAIEDPDAMVARMEEELLESTLNDSLAFLSPEVAEELQRAEVGVMPDLRGLTKQQVWERLVPTGLRWDVQGTGWLIAQDPPAGAPLKDVRLCRLIFSSKRTEHHDNPAPVAPASTL